MSRGRTWRSLALCSGVLAACGARTGLVVEPLAAPRQIAPLSTARVTNQRPTFRWTMPAGATAVRVELCADPGCATVSTAFESADQHARPSERLAPGTWYWRLRARYGAVLDGPRGPVWQLRVPASDAAVDTSWGQTLDVDRDGFSEWAVLQTLRGMNGLVIGHVHVFAGGGTISASARPAFTLVDPPSGYDLPVPSAAGDLDGDGFPELLVANGGVNADEWIDGRLRVFAGGASGLPDPARPTVLLTRPHMTAAYDSTFTGSAAGDVDGDGYGDLVAGCADGAFLYRGGPDGVSATRFELFDQLDDGATDAPSAAGGVDGDGYADVVVTRHAVGETINHIVLFWGSGTGLSTSTEITGLVAPHAGFVFADPQCIGDLNGDGYADLAIGSDTVTGTDAPHVTIVWGGPGGALRATGTNPPADPDDTEPITTVEIADCDGDGFDDLLAFEERFGTGPRQVNWFVAGGADGPRAIGSPWRALGLPPPYLTDTFAAGDIDGDGRTDIVTDYPVDPTAASVPVDVYLSTAAGPPLAPTAMVSLPP